MRRSIALEELVAHASRRRRATEGAQGLRLRDDAFLAERTARELALVASDRLECARWTILDQGLLDRGEQRGFIRQRRGGAGAGGAVSMRSTVRVVGRGVDSIGLTSCSSTGR
jgi:hypothetical protein